VLYIIAQLCYEDLHSVGTEGVFHVIFDPGKRYHVICFTIVFGGDVRSARCHGVLAQRVG
jgi:hypothetical protein